MRPEDRLLVRAAAGARWLPPLFGIAALLSALADLALPYLLGRTLDAVLAPDGASGGGPVDGGPGSGGVLPGFDGGYGWWLLLCLVVLGVLVLCEAVADWAAASGSVASTAWLRRVLTRHVVGLGADATRWRTSGDLTGRIIGNADEAGAAAPAAITAAAAIVPTGGGLVALALIDPMLAVAFGAGLLVLLPLLRIFVHDASTAVAGYQRAQGELAGRLIGAVRGARTIAAAGAARTEAARVLTPLPALRRHGEDTWRAQARLSAQGQLLVPWLQVVVLGLAGAAVAWDRITPGEMLAAIRYVALGTGLGLAIGGLNRLLRARTAAHRATELLSRPAPAYGTRSLPPGPGRLTLQSVSTGPPPPEATTPTTESAALSAEAATPSAEAATPSAEAAAPSAEAAAPSATAPSGRTPSPRAAPPPVATANGGPSGPTSPAPAVPSPVATANGGGTSDAGDGGTRGPGGGGTSGAAGGGLVDVSLDVPGGSTLAVVGPAGAGKSLLAALPGRLAEPSRGSVLIDGVPVPELSREALEQAVTYAFERPVLFGATVEAAIAAGTAPGSGTGTAPGSGTGTAPGSGHDGGLGAEPAPRGRLREAVRDADAEEFVLRLPSGYATPLSEVRLSGGELQRLGLARAFAHDGRVLVLDDATSSLDTVTELRVRSAVATGMTGRTRIIVTHRATTAAAADLVAWLDRGRLRGLAPHATLWNDPAYRALFTPEDEP